MPIGLLLRMSDFGLLVSQLSGIAEAALATFAVALIYWRTGHGIVFPVLMFVFLSIYGLLLPIWLANLLVLERITQDQFTILYDSREWLLAIALLVLAIKTWPSKNGQTQDWGS